MSNAEMTFKEYFDKHPLRPFPDSGYSLEDRLTVLGFGTKPPPHFNMFAAKENSDNPTYIPHFKCPKCESTDVRTAPNWFALNDFGIAFTCNACNYRSTDYLEWHFLKDEVYDFLRKAKIKFDPVDNVYKIFVDEKSSDNPTDKELFFFPDDVKYLDGNIEITLSNDDYHG